MKKTYIYNILLLLSLLSSISSYAQIITVSDVPASLCANESFTISYDGSFHTYNSGNVFTVELSASDGSYPGVAIGTLASTESTGTIKCTIPTNTIFSSSYSIRVNTTNSSLGAFSGSPSGVIDINCTTRDYYWKGGSGNWSDLTHWEYTTDNATFTAATEPPLSTDNVSFDENSFPSGGQVTIDVSATCNDMYWNPASGTNNPVLYSNGSSLSVYGDFELSPGVYNELYYVYFYPDKYNIYLNFGDNLFQPDINKRRYYFYNNYSYELDSDIDANRVYISSGTFNTNDFNITLENYFINYGTFNAGGSTIDASSAQIYGTFNGLSSTIVLHPTDYNDQPILYGGGQTLGTLVIQSGVCNIYDNRTITNLLVNNGGGLNLASGSIQTVTTTFTAQGTNRGQLAVIKSQSSGNQATIMVSGATVISADYVNISDNIIDNGGSGIFSATNAVDGGNNTNWSFSLLTPLEYYWINGTGNWSDITHWQTSADGGSTFSSVSEGPAPIDNIYFTTNSFPSGGTLTLDSDVETNNMTWETGSGSSSPTIYSNYPTELIIHGSLQLTDGVKRNLYRINFDSDGTGNTIDLADNLNNGSDIDFNGTGEWTLLSDLSTAYLNLRGGTLNTNNRTITVDEQIYLDTNNTGTVNWSSSIVNLRSIYNDAASINFNAQTSTFNFQAVNGGTCQISGIYPLNFNTVNVLNNLNLFNSSYTFNNLSFSPGITVQLASGYTQTINNSFVAMGTRSQMITIASYSPGSPATLFINTGTASISVDYAIIKDNILDNASGLTTTENATHSIDKGNNSGWNFSSNPLTSLNYYWVGGTGNWSDTNHWATSDGGSTFYSEAPGTLDNIYFTSSSFTSDGTLTLDHPVRAHTMDWTGNTSLVSIYENGNYDNSLTISGSLLLANGVSRDFSQLIFDSDETGLAIDLADNLKGYNEVTFYGTGEWSLASNFDADQARFYGGTFYTNGFDFTSDDIRLYDDNISFWGSSDVYTSSFSSYALNDPLTFNAESSTFYFEQPYNSIDANGSNFNTVFINGDENYMYGDIVFNNVTLNTGKLYVYDTKTFGSFSMEPTTMLYAYGNHSYGTFTAAEGSTLLILDGNTQTITTALNLNGTVDNPIIVNSTTDGNVGTFSAAFGVTVTADYVHLKDNTATGGATFQATNSSDFGNVMGWSGLKTGQTITFGPLNDVYQDNGAFTVSATSDSGLDPVFEIASGPATAGGTNGTTITPTGSGLVAIKAVQTGNSTYGTASPITQYVHIDATHEPNELGNMKEARLVLGQPDNVTNDFIFTSTSTAGPYQVAVSSTGQMAVGQRRRLLIWNKIPDNSTTPADVVIGQVDFDSSDDTAPASASSFSPAAGNPTAYSVQFSNSDKLIVSDYNRVLIWNTIPTTNNTPADIVLGQPDFTSTNNSISEAEYGGGVITATTYYDGGSGNEKLIVSDPGNNRVLIYNTIPTASFTAADVVIGQPDFYSNSSGNGADQLYGPEYCSVSSDGKLLIADFYNNRVVGFNSIPNSNGASADFVLGQSDFGFSDPDIGPNSLYRPYGLSISRTNKLAITDFGNNRVLIYNTIPTDNTVPPDFVLGQPDANSNETPEISGRTMLFAVNANWDISENLFVCDRNNNRVLIYGAPDTEGPTITDFTVAASPYVKGGSNQVTTLTATDRSGVASATAFYNDVNYLDTTNPTYEQIEMTDMGNGVFEFDLSAVESLGSLPTGMEYFIEVYDNLGNVFTSSDDKQVLPINYPNGISINGYGVGKSTENYRIMAVPAILDNQAVEHVFQDIFSSGYDNTEMRIFSYAGGSATTYNEASGSTNLQVGTGYFALAASGSSSSVTSPDGALTSFISTDNGFGENIHEFDIDLVPGWNLIGNPFQHDVVWNDVKALSGITAGQVDNLQNYTGSYTTITNIPAGGGAFVSNNTGSNFTLRIPAKINSGGRMKGLAENDNPLSEPSWEVWFRAYNATNEEVVLGGVGMEEDAVVSKDEFDWLNPPSFAQMKLIDFSHPEFRISSFKKDIRPTSLNEKWEFTYKVDNPSHEQHELHWNNTHFGDGSPDIYLVDKTHFEVINMKEENSYTFNHEGQTEFEVYFGENVLEEIMPEEVISQSPYPNPFTNEVNFSLGLPLDEGYKVEIRIFDAMGKTVRYLSKDEISSGYNSIKWDGLNTDGRILPGGIYAFSIHIKGVKIDSVHTGKLIKR